MSQLVVIALHFGRSQCVLSRGSVMCSVIPENADPSLMFADARELKLIHNQFDGLNLSMPE